MIKRADPGHVGLFRLRAPMAHAQRLAYAIEESRLALRLSRSGYPESGLLGGRRRSRTKRELTPGRLGISFCNKPGRAVWLAGQASAIPGGCERWMKAASTILRARSYAVAVLEGKDRVQPAKAALHGWCTASASRPAARLFEPMAHVWHTRTKKPKPPAGFEPATR